MGLDELVRLTDTPGTRLRGHRHRPPGQLGCQHGPPHPGNSSASLGNQRQLPRRAGVTPPPDRTVVPCQPSAEHRQPPDAVSTALGVDPQQIDPGLDPVQAPVERADTRREQSKPLRGAPAARDVKQAAPRSRSQSGSSGAARAPLRQHVGAPGRATGGRHTASVQHRQLLPGEDGPDRSASGPRSPILHLPFRPTWYQGRSG
jgi:hypothetical protein